MQNARNQNWKWHRNYLEKLDESYQSRILNAGQDPRLVTEEKWNWIACISKLKWFPDRIPILFSSYINLTSFQLKAAEDSLELESTRTQPWRWNTFSRNVLMGRQTNCLYLGSAHSKASRARRKWSNGDVFLCLSSVLQQDSCHVMPQWLFRESKGWQKHLKVFQDSFYDFAAFLFPELTKVLLILQSPGWSGGIDFVKYSLL